MSRSALLTAVLKRRAIDALCQENHAWLWCSQEYNNQHRN